MLKSFLCGLAGLLACQAIGLGDETLRDFSERLKAEAFPKAALVNAGELKQAGHRPTWFLTIDDGGARAKRLAAKKARDPIAGFFDAVSSLNWENRIYITQCDGGRDAELFAAEKDGLVALNSVTIGAISRGDFVVWGDFRLIEAVKGHWGIAPDEARKARIAKLAPFDAMRSALWERVFPDAEIEVWERWSRPNSKEIEDCPLVVVSNPVANSRESDRVHLVKCKDSAEAKSLLTETSKDFSAFIVDRYVVWGDKRAVEQLRRKKAVITETWSAEGQKTPSND